MRGGVPTARVVRRTPSAPFSSVLATSPREAAFAGRLHAAIAVHSANPPPFGRVAAFPRRAQCAEPPTAPFSSAPATSPREAAFAGRLHAAISVHFAQKRLSWEMRGGVPTARVVRRTPPAPSSSAPFLRGLCEIRERHRRGMRRAHTHRSTYASPPAHPALFGAGNAASASFPGVCKTNRPREAIFAGHLRAANPSRSWQAPPMRRAFLPAGAFAAIMRKARTGARRFRRGTAKAAGNRKSDFRQILAPCPRWDRRRKGTHPPCTGRR